MLNMAVNVHLVPVTGLTLPMISMGGSSIWFTSIAIGIVLSVSRYVDEMEGVKKPEKKPRKKVTERTFDEPAEENEEVTEAATEEIAVAALEGKKTRTTKPNTGVTPVPAV